MSTGTRADDLEAHDATGYDHAACALLTCVTNGQIVACNTTLLRWIGQDQRPASLFDLLAPASMLFFEMQLRPLLALGRTVDGAFLTLRHADGSDLPVVINAVQPRGASTIELAMLSVRERMQYEARLRDANREAEAALGTLTATAHAHKMQAVGQMAAGVAHEFNNLLAVIRGNVQFAQQGLESVPHAARVQADLEAALTATERAVAIVGQLLSFTGRKIVRRAPLDVNDVIEQAAQLILPALGRDVTWQTRFAPALPAVFAARDQLQHVITELVLNARDAIRQADRPGVIMVVTALVTAGRDGRRGVRLTISDTGCGMDDETLRRAIDPFFSTKGPGNGSGLGLSMVYGAVNALGGTTEITSTVDVGTTVTIELPAAH